MGFRDRLHTITGTSPAAAGTAVIGTVKGLQAYDAFQIFITGTGGANSAGDIAWLQFKLDADVDVWVDWIRFPAITAGGAYKCLVSTIPTNTITVVGSGTTASPGSVALAANTCAGGVPGDTARLVYTAGASTSAGATQTCYIRGWRRRT